MNRADFGEAYQSGFRSTVRFLARQGIDGHVAEEIAQGAWARGWERISQLRNEQAVTAWVKQIALNAYREGLAAERRNVPLTDLAGEIHPNTAAIDLQRVLKTCSPPERALLCHTMRGLTTQEIGRIVGATGSAVRIRLMRARRSARRAIAASVEGLPTELQEPEESNAGLPMSTRN